MLRVIFCMVIGCAALAWLSLFKLDQRLAGLLFVGCALALIWVIGTELAHRKRYRNGEW